MDHRAVDRRLIRDEPIELIARGDYKKVAKLIAEIQYPGVA